MRKFLGPVLITEEKDIYPFEIRLCSIIRTAVYHKSRKDLDDCCQGNDIIIESCRDILMALIGKSWLGETESDVS